ncbi:hypothetical protein QT235_03175 [Geobacillus stearothermophilus]|nr:hypothetical protein QT235_03175 [Geobacillus stearothermophilus]WJQ11146.1 hypothetical protein QT237_03100 [Geobacillus stearothermophilus]
MKNYSLIFLQRIAARKALEQKQLSREKYEDIMKTLDNLEEEIRYEKKLQEYNINKTKEMLYKEYTSV